MPRPRTPRPSFPAAWLALAAAGCGAEAPSQGPGDTLLEGAFPDEAGPRGLDYVNVSGSPEKPTILEANGPGCALLDLASDGDLDVLFTQGAASVSALAAGEGASLELFVNEGGGRYRADPGGLPEQRAWWTGLACGDVDGDGSADVVAGGFGALVVLRQVPAEERLEPIAPLPDAPLPVRELDGTALWTTSLALFDAEGDGDLDLFAGRYVAFDPASPPRGELAQDDASLAVPCWWAGYEVFCGPRGMRAQPDALFRGAGDGTFEDVSERWLGEREPAYTLGVAAFDADLDGASDLYVAVDSQPNRLWVNFVAPRGRFEDMGYAAGVAVSPDGAPEAGMGIAVGDVNTDGRFDLAVTNFSGEPTQLYLGGELGFQCASYRTGLAHATRAELAWGAHLTDFTGDGRLELFTATGHVYPQADLPDTNTSYAQRDRLFAFDAEGRARALEPRGAVFGLPSGSRGSAVGDVDGDGAPDLVVARIDGPCALGINRLDPEARRLELVLASDGRPGPEGRRTPRDAMGTRVLLQPTPAMKGLEPRPLLAEVQTSRGFQSASSPRLHFGLGRAESFAGIVVSWPSGRRETLPGGAADRRLFVEEGRGIVREEEL